MANEQREDAVGAILPVAEAEDVLAKIESDPSMKRRYDANKKSVMKAYLLWLFLGWFGGHRFYLGYIPSAIFLILMSSLGIILTIINFVGVFVLVPPGLWLLVDGFIIPAIVRNQNDRLVEQILR